MSRKPNPKRDLVESGLMDRSERPTTHARFAPLEARKQREEERLRGERPRARRGRGGRAPRRTLRDNIGMAR
jgi:hypothetical protein